MIIFQEVAKVYVQKIAIIAGLLFFSGWIHANPVACFKTNVGDFCMELFERQTPKTVENFRNYVNSGAYAQSFFHRSVPGFVVQGGGFKVTSGETGALVSRISTFEPVKNEPGISNILGTVAMAKVANNPDSATSQWFVNLVDNSTKLDFNNGGFTVFAKILFSGMNVINAIEDLEVINKFASPLNELPLINYDITQIPQLENFVVINSVDIHDVTGVFDGSAVSFAVDAGGSFYDVRLNLVSAQPEIVFELDPANIEQLSAAPANGATFSAQDGLLTIPSVIINETTIVNNVVLSLTDPAVFQFTLVSFE